LFILHPFDEIRTIEGGLDRGAVDSALARCGQSSAFSRQPGINEAN
jgi:hypothetical protein